jgi:hypothetical protein
MHSHSRAGGPSDITYARSLRYSDSDYEKMADLAYQAPPGYHQRTLGGSRKPRARARRPCAPVNYQISQTVIENLAVQIMDIFVC